MKLTSPTEEGRLLENDTLVQGLSRAVKDGGVGLRDVPRFLKSVIKESRWQSRLLHQGRRVVTFKRFDEFVTTPPLDGMGTTIEMLRHICADDPEALDLLDRVMQRGHGGDRKSEDAEIKIDNINLDSIPDGTSRAAALRRLRSQRPDLHAKVIAKKMTPHAAMIEAGFRKRTITVTLDPEQAMGALYRACKREKLDWSDFIEAAKHARR